MLGILCSVALFANNPQSPPPRVQWVMVRCTHCVPCVAAERDLKRLEKHGWRVGASDAHIRIVNADNEDATRYRAQQYPTFVLLVDGVETNRHSSYPGHLRIAKEYNAEVIKLK